jgi:hypothetical protein
MATDALIFSILYQVPSLLLGLVLNALIPHPAIRAIFVLPGTFVHEFLHLIVGLILNGKPVSISLWPRRVGHGQWVLGTVGFANPRWYNAVFIGLAPLLAFVGAMLLAPAARGWSPQMSDLRHWAIATPILAMCVPSTVDLRLSLKSWPILCGMVAWFTWSGFKA